MKPLPLAISLFFAAAVSTYLGIHVHSSRWTMAADEAVHSIDGLRLYNDLHHGRVEAFFRDTYFSERWHPPVNNDLRWYPFVHSWAVAASFLILGPSDFSARLPSVLFLFGSSMLFYAIGWRLGEDHRAISAVTAVLLLLSAPNIISFFASALTEACVFFMCYLAILAYLWYLERPGSPARSVLAGLAVSGAILAKYDHGAMVALAVVIFESVRARFHPVRLLRGGAAPLFLTMAAVLAAWFGHPDKVRALFDATRLSITSSSYVLLASLISSPFWEYSSDPVIAVLMIISAFAAYRYRKKTGIMALWTFALVGTLFLSAKGRFWYRYNIVEAPALLLLLAVMLPDWISKASRRMQRWSPSAALAILVTGAAGIGAGVLWRLGHSDLFSETTRLFVWLYRLSPRHMGLSLDARHYVAYLASLKAGFEYVEVAVPVVSVALVVVGLPVLFRKRIAPALIAGLGITFVAGAVQLYAHAGRMVDWEIGGAPALHQIPDFVEQHIPQRSEILLAGAWNNFANNSLRWYLLTGYRPRDFGDILVWGATIGSIVLPPQPRIEYWANQLEHAPPSQLPDAIVLIQPTAQFRYTVDYDQDAEVYRKILSLRDIYKLAATTVLSAVGCKVDVYQVNRDAAAPALSIAAPIPPRVPVGPNGWVQTENPWRQFWNPLLY